MLQGGPSPGGACALLARRIGVAFKDSLLTPSLNGLVIGSNSSFRSVRGIDPAALTRADLLPTEQCKRIERAHRHLYRAFEEHCDPL